MYTVFEDGWLVCAFPSYGEAKAFADALISATIEFVNWHFMAA